jgi:hypothetical protein
MVSLAATRQYCLGPEAIRMASILLLWVGNE